MANITFYLSSVADKKGLKPILIQITHNYQRVRIPSGEKIKTSIWNKKKQRAYENKELGNEAEYTRINNFLNDVESKFKKMVGKAKLNDIEMSSDFFKENLFKADIKPKRSFYDVMDEYISASKSIRAKGTIEKYEISKKFYQRFEKDTNFKITLNSIDLTFYDRFKDYVFTERSLSDNTFAKLIKNMKAVLTWAKDREYYKGEIYKKFKTTEYGKEVIYLRVEELFALYNHNFEKASLAKARDMFCFSCFTGFRFSDTLSLRRESINLKDGTISKWIDKTQRFEKIPLNSYALKILEKYKDDIFPLPQYAKNTVNDYIKLCCKDVGINEMTTITKHSGNKRIETTKPKYDLISTHAARKTFVTNSLILGMNLKTIKSITGHKLDSSFERYVKIAEDFQQKEMADTWEKIDIKVTQSKAETK